MRVTLIADSGATKCEWCLLVDGKKKKTIITDGLSPYFLTADQITALLQMHLLPKIKNFTPKNIFFASLTLTTTSSSMVLLGSKYNTFFSGCNSVMETTLFL